MGETVFVTGEMNELEDTSDAADFFCTWHAADVKAEHDIFGNRHVRPEGVILEDHAGVTFFGG